MLNISFSVQDLEFFLLIFVRITSFLVTAPFYSISNVPYRAKVGVGFFLAMLIYQFVVPHNPLVYNTVIGYGILVLKEAIVGVVLGLGCNVMVAVTTLSGKVIDMETGLSMLSMFDPTTRTSEGFSGMFYHYMVMLILVISNMHHYLIRAFVESYQLIPTGGVVINYDKLMVSTIQFMTSYMMLGFRICLPVFASMLLVNSILGVLAKTAPQIHIFAVGVQMKVLIGLSVMFVSIGLIPSISDMMYEEIKRMMVLMIGLFS